MGNIFLYSVVRDQIKRKIMDIPMNKKQYATSWEEESHTLENNKIYEKLVNLLPNGKVLEIGCGSG